MMHLCWLGETNFDYPFSPTDLPTATAIQINGGLGGTSIAKATADGWSDVGSIW